MNEEIQPEIIATSSEIIFQQDKAMIDTQISTAKAYPRNMMQAQNNAISIVTNDMETAKACIYALPRGGKTISGPSVHMAKIIAQFWGNMRAETKVIEIGQTQITSQAVCFDLENNLAIKVEVKRSIMSKKGRFNDDMITVTGNAANAIALRNAIYAVVPKNVVDKVFNAAKSKITGDISDEQKLIAKRTQVINLLKDTYNVTEEEILASIGKASVNHINADDILNLIGFGQSIKDGDSTVDEIFRPTNAKNGTTREEEEVKRLNEWIDTAKDLTKLKEANGPVYKTGNTELIAKFEAKLKELGGELQA